MQNFLKRHYLNNEKLKQRTLIEFSNWVSTGRMIAFTGAMTTENMGYGSWSELSESYLQISSELIRALPDFSKKAQIETALSSVKSAMKEDNGYDKRVAFSIAREALRQADEVNRRNRHLSLEEFRKTISEDGISGLTDLRARLVEQAKRFVEDFSLESILGCAVATLFHFRLNTASGPVTARELLRQLGIKRFATLSYDLELEDALMTERGALEKFDTHTPYDNLVKAIQGGQIRCDEDIPSRWQALLHNGRHVESNILLRERPDLLVEFATGSTRLTQHIMHMHGRACTPDSMIVGLRDYDSLYRKTDISTLPFEHARQLLFTGNPLLFIGLGMSETEVNATLQTYVSNNPYRYLTPNFLLWNSSGFPKERKERAAMMFAKRVAWLQSLGVMVIFDEDLEDLDLGRKIDHIRKLKTQASAEIPVGTTKAEERVRQRIQRKLKSAVRKAEVNLLPATVEALAKRVAHVWTTSATHSPEADQSPQWRSMRPRFVPEKKAVRDDRTYRTYRLWSREKVEGEQGQLATCFDNLFAPDSPVVRVIIGKPGSGKGALARQIVDNAGIDVAGNQYLLINAGFSFDTDSLLNALKHFMFKVRDPDRYVPKSGEVDSSPAPIAAELVSKEAPESGEATSTTPSDYSREQFFCDPASFSKVVPIENAATNPFVKLIKTIFQPVPINRDALIVVNGMERFFSIDGRPLSGELDHILRSIAGLEAGKTRFSFVFLGTARTQRYFETILGNRNNILGVDQIGFEPTNESKPVCGTKVKSRYFREIEQAFWDNKEDPLQARRSALPYSDITIIDNNADSDIDSLRRAFFRAYLDPAVLKAGGISDPELALDLLRTLAFVGAPVEAIVLAHAPAIRRRITDGKKKAPDYGEILHDISECLDSLKRKFLVVPVKSHESYRETGDYWKRYGLHKTLLKELRARHGIPLSPAKRSTAFNMSLYASQPIDGDSPEPQVHEELGGLVDSLIGAYKDFRSERKGIFVQHPNLVSEALKRVNRVLPSPVNSEEDAFLLQPETSAALRAALAVIRGYYSTSSLLRIDRHDRNCGDDNDGALLDHAERLHRLLRGYRKVVKARASMRKAIDDSCAQDKVELRTKMGPEPFYRDELVWLHNEMGVVQLTMGNLYAAEAALNRAVAANRMVEFDHHSHNWRRITLNYILLDIERARLLDAESKIETVERAINERKPQWKPNDHGKRSRVDHIIWAYGKETPVSTDCFDTDIMHEEMLSIGLTRGFRGLCAHLAGRLSDADEDYTTAIHILRRIGDQRAYALFLRRHGELKFALGEKAAAEMLLQKALSVADYGRQMDIVYQTMMVQHIHLSVGSSTKPAVNVSQDSVAQAYSTLKDTLEYSRALDIYRVRADASARLARLWLSRGDANAALESAHDAMAVAASFGMSLRKIQLRALIGQIYLQRGDPKAGRGMLDEAIDAADRVGYQRAIALARQIRNGNG